MNPIQLATQLNAEKIQQIFSQLPSGQRNELGQYFTPAQWAQKIGDVLRQQSGLPANFAAMELPLQISFALAKIMRDSPPSGPPHSVDQFSQRAAEVIAAGLIKVSPFKNLQSLIEHTDAVKAANSGGHFLNRQEDAG